MRRREISETQPARGTQGMGGVNLIKTVQDASEKFPNGIGLILDIDVFLMNYSGDQEGLKKCLETMRVIKNMVFFSSITKQLVEDLK